MQLEPCGLNAWERVLEGAMISRCTGAFATAKGSPAPQIIGGVCVALFEGHVRPGPWLL